MNKNCIIHLLGECQKEHYSQNMNELKSYFKNKLNSEISILCENKGNYTTMFSISIYIKNISKEELITKIDKDIEGDPYALFRTFIFSDRDIIEVE